MLNEWIDEVTWVLARIGFAAAHKGWPRDGVHAAVRYIPLADGNVGWYSCVGEWLGDYAKGDRPAFGHTVTNRWVG